MSRDDIQWTYLHRRASIATFSFENFGSCHASVVNHSDNFDVITPHRFVVKSEIADTAQGRRICFNYFFYLGISKRKTYFVKVDNYFLKFV